MADCGDRREHRGQSPTGQATLAQGSLGERLREQVYIDACHRDYVHQRVDGGVYPCPVCQAIERGIDRALAWMRERDHDNHHNALACPHCAGPLKNIVDLAVRVVGFQKACPFGVPRRLWEEFTLALESTRQSTRPVGDQEGLR